MFIFLVADPRIQGGTARSDIGVLAHPSVVFFESVSGCVHSIPSHQYLCVGIYG